MNQRETVAKDKFFSLRLSQALAERIERAKPYFGDRISTGEAVRQLMERGLDQIDQRNPAVLSSPRKRPRETLMLILGKWHDKITLTCAEWIFLAKAVHNAYRASGDHRDRVARATYWQITFGPSKRSLGSRNGNTARAETTKEIVTI